VSQRDLVHVLQALSRLSGADPKVSVPVAAIDDAIGRGDRDMRTPLNLESLRVENLVAQLPDGGWALTEHGLARLQDDRDFAGSG
jgi:hypothetical protein